VKLGLGGTGACVQDDAGPDTAASAKLNPFQRNINYSSQYCQWKTSFTVKR